MNGVGLPTVGRLLGHRRLATTAIYAHLDDAALPTATEKAAGRIAKAMGFTVSAPVTVVWFLPLENAPTRRFTFRHGPR